MEKAVQSLCSKMNLSEKNKSQERQTRKKFAETFQVYSGDERRVWNDSRITNELN